MVYSVDWEKARFSLDNSALFGLVQWYDEPCTTRVRSQLDEETFENSLPVTTRGSAWNLKTEQLNRDISFEKHLLLRFHVLLTP